MGAEEPEQARPSWALKDSPLHLQHRHCTQTGKPWGLSAGEVLGGELQVAPAARSCLAFGPQLLGLPMVIMDSALAPNLYGGHLQAELRRLVEGPYHLYWAQGGL